ncbi:hypothetical protein [Roseateles sp.]|uniref:hypothetical protein n=1 Tax=Roseateles sp. TaxID=1971397 RepID=UPI00286AA6ED|nr:hypothetical protein [Roseateles sp.]
MNLTQYRSLKEPPSLQRKIMATMFSRKSDHHHSCARSAGIPFIPSIQAQFSCSHMPSGNVGKAAIGSAYFLGSGGIFSQDEGDERDQAYKANRVGT